MLVREGTQSSDWLLQSHELRINKCISLHGNLAEMQLQNSNLQFWQKYFTSPTQGYAYAHNSNVEICNINVAR